MMLRPILVVCLLTTTVRADFPKLFNTEPVEEATRMSAETAAAKMQLPAGFKATVFAAEPDVQNPIDMSWDSRGRLWVAENYTYAERKQRFQLDLRDRVVIFDNTHGDRFSKRTVFTDQVTMLTGLEVGHDGVWLMCPPKLIFIPDRDHDDVPDSAGEVVLDGFTVAHDNYHNFANGLRFGPDGWLYGRCGGSCPARIGRPGQPDHRRLALEGGIWRYHPGRQHLEVLTSGTTNPWGHDWNEVGELFFTNTVNGHLWHVTAGAHFTRPFLLDPNRRTYELIDFHADHWHFDTGQSWTKSRDGAANSYGGGHAHSGAMIYQGDNWPEPYRGNLFTFNFHGRRANQEILVRRDSGYVAQHGKDFLIAADTWFRGMELSTGPDGAVFVLDWSDAGECHEHTGVHRTSGRIFKIKYGREKGASTRRDAHELPDLRDWTGQALADAHASANNWYVRQARLELARRAAQGKDLTAAIGALRSDFEASSDDAPRAVQALLSLHQIGGTDDELLQSQLAHPQEHVRVWAIRLLTEHCTLDDNLGPAWITEGRQADIEATAARLTPIFTRMAQRDPSALVRLALASALQRLPVASRATLGAALVSRSEDADDHNIPLMIWYGLMAVADEDCRDLVPVAGSCLLPTTLRLISRCLAEEIKNEPRAINQLLALAAASKDEQYRSTVLSGISQGLQGWRQAPKPDAWEDFAKTATAAMQPTVRELSVLFGDGRALDEIRQIALEKNGAESAVRLAALQTLIQQEPDDLKSVCQQLLSDAHLNVLAARGLSKFDDPEIGKAIVDRYYRFRSPFRPQIVSILVSRRSFAKQLLQAIADEKIPRADLSAFHVRQIHSFGDAELSAQVGEVWGEVRESSKQKQERIESLKQALTPQLLARADLSIGRALFAGRCQNCHRLYGEGSTIGPDLTGSDRSNLDYLLSNIIDPSAVVDKNYRMSILLTDDDRIINGLVIDETDQTITIQTDTEKLTFDRESIQSRKVTEKSPMPDGLLETLSRQQIRSLVAYLSHPSQVPLPGN